MGSFDAKSMNCDKSYSDFTGWDFEDETMGSWEVITESSNYKWDIIGAFKSAYKNYSHLHDHTTMSVDGYLAEATSIKQSQLAANGTRTALRSPKVRNSNAKASKYCLSFWFLKRTGNDLLEIIQETDQLNNTV